MSAQTITPTPLHEPAPYSRRIRVGQFLSGPAGRNIGLVIALAIIMLAGSITAGSRFVNLSNFFTIVNYATVVGVLSIGATFVIIAGGIDLSVGSLLGLVSVITTLPSLQLIVGSNWILMVIVALAVGVLAGLINGMVIAYGNVVAFMATLAMMVAARGLAEILSDRTTQIVTSPGFLTFFGGKAFGVPILIWMFLLVAVFGWILLNRTTFGRRTIAIGGNREAARLAGIKVKRHMVYVYACAGLTAGIAAIMMIGRTTVGTSTHGIGYELDAIAAVVVGGTLLVGGRGTIVGTVLGTLIFATLINVFTQNNLSTSVQALVKGIIIVVAVLLQQKFAASKKMKARA
jgi:ribose transport system permease protein